MGPPCLVALKCADPANWTIPGFLASRRPSYSSRETL
jgi:hypothetical protein